MDCCSGLLNKNKLQSYLTSFLVGLDRARAFTSWALACIKCPPAQTFPSTKLWTYFELFQKSEIYLLRASNSTRASEPESRLVSAQDPCDENLKKFDKYNFAQFCVPEWSSRAPRKWPGGSKANGIFTFEIIKKQFRDIWKKTIMT